MLCGVCLGGRGWGARAEGVAPTLSNERPIERAPCPLPPALTGFCFTWACCPLPEATCCEDHEHCCPSNLPVCDTVAGRCLAQAGEGYERSAPWSAKVPAMRKERERGGPFRPSTRRERGVASA